MRIARLDKYHVGAGFLIFIGILLRLLFITLDWPAAYNDEGTVGLMARHIAYKGAHPLLYYGQDYMGSLEAYLGAFFFHLFGPSTFSLRLGLLVLYALFLLCMYRLTSMLYSKSLALFTLLILALGSPEVIFRQLMTAGGPPDYFFFTALLVLLTSWIVLTIPQNTMNAALKDQPSGTTPKTGPLPLQRLLAYAAWALVAGLDIWSHLLCIPFVVGAGLVLVLFCRHEMRLKPLILILLLLCLVIGASPQLIYKITVPVTTRENSLFMGVFGGGYREPNYPAPPAPQDEPPQHETTPQATISPKPIPPIPGLQVAGTILVSIPVATNGTALCPMRPQDAWPLLDHMSTSALVCTGVHGVWGAGFLILWGVAIALAIQRVRSLRRFLGTKEETDKMRYELRIQALRLMLLCCAGSTILVFLLYPQAAAVTPWNSARYLVGLLIAFPAVLAPIWDTLPALMTRQRWQTRFKGLGSYAICAILLLTCLLGVLNIFTSQVGPASKGYQQQFALIAYLSSIGATHVYMDYDDCNRISFLSNEQIICAVMDKGLHPGLDRYYPYRQQVASATHPFYVFQKGSTQAAWFEWYADQQHITYQVYHQGGYNIYTPERPLKISE